MKHKITLGQPTYNDYVPEIKVRDVKGRNSRATKVTSYKTNRVHHLLSDLEYYYFLYLEWSDDVLDIREQFPLKQSTTEDIALGMKVKHPSYLGTNIVMTTDFVITLENGYLVRTVKPSSELQKQRVLEKLSIEREYWNQLDPDIDWGIVTEKELDRTFVSNLELIRNKRDYIVDNKVKDDYIIELKSALSPSETSLVEIFDFIDAKYAAEEFSAL